MNKPEGKPYEALNILDALNYLENEGYTGIKDRLWKYLCSEESFVNGSLFEFWLPEKDEVDEQLWKDLKLFKRVFKIKGESIILEVSW